MARQFLVSVVIPTFNRVDGLKKALRSVLAQTVPAYEIIVVDDGSTDTTRQMISKDFAASVSYYDQQNQGVSAARNAGIQRASGNWIAFLDSDDEWLPKKLQMQINLLSQRPEYNFCHTNEIWIRNGIRVNSMVKHEKSGGHIFEKCLPLCVISPSSVLVKKTVFDELGGFDESLPACEDYDFWLRYCCRYPVLFVDTPLLVKYGGHEDQLSRKYWGMDQFRLKALLNILTVEHLARSQQRAVVEMFLQKCKILEEGASKRGNQTILNFCYSMRSQLKAWQQEANLQFDVLS